MPNLTPKIKGLPVGWRVLMMQSSEGRRDAVVLCERNVEDGDHGTRYVVWWYDRINGGVYTGSYLDSKSDAVTEFNARTRRLI